MLKLDQARMDQMERQYPGILEQILVFEKLELPKCPECESANTAEVQCGIIGRTMNLAAATTKLRLVANGPKPGRYFCNVCSKFFGKPDPTRLSF